MKDSLLICPTYESDGDSLFSHKISQAMCDKRQSGHYHKCSNCTLSRVNGYVLTPLPPIIRKMKRTDEVGANGKTESHHAKVGIQPVAFGRQLRWRWADVEDGIARATAPTKGRDRVVPLRSGRGDFAARIAKLRRDVRESTS